MTVTPILYSILPAEVCEPCARALLFSELFGLCLSICPLSWFVFSIILWPVCTVISVLLTTFWLMILIWIVRKPVRWIQQWRQIEDIQGCGILDQLKWLNSMCSVAVVKSLDGEGLNRYLRAFLTKSDLQNIFRTLKIHPTPCQGFVHFWKQWLGRSQGKPIR